MSDLAAPLAVAGLGTAAFCCFTWGTLRHFARQGAGSAGAWVVSLVSLGAYLCFARRVGEGAVASVWPASCLLFLGSVALWFWTLKRTRVTPPTLAFMEDAPQRLFHDGPYEWVRHPFYTSYMAFWVGTAMAVQGSPGWLFTGILGVIYWVAARHEEGKFAHSGLAKQYRFYAARTGMFLPRLGLPKAG